MKNFDTQQTNHANFVVGLFALVVLSVASLSILKSAGLLSGDLGQAVQSHDLIFHVAFALVLGGLAGLASRASNKPMVALLLFFVVTDELLQIWLPTRQFSWLDMACNVFGCLAGVLICHFTLFAHAQWFSRSTT